MKQKYSIIFLAVLSAVFSCVQVDEGMLDEGAVVERVEMTFTATIDDEDADTKTVLDGELGSGTRKVLWQPSDAIGVSAQTSQTAGYPSVEKFTATITEDSESSAFEGTISFASEYHAFYPYQTELRDSMGFFVFKMPQVQKYVDGSFDPNSAPMVAVAKYGENLKFKNLFGVLALRLSGNESVKNITFIGRDENGNAMPVSGTYEVAPVADGTPEARCLKGVPSVTLECASEVALGAESSVPFYFVLPPATYHSFLVMIETMDGKIMLKEGKNPLTIKRSDVQPTAALQYVETVYIDLSERGNANSYIVPKAGLYTFDADIIGNGEFGIVDGANFHTSNTSISPASVEVLWEDSEGIVAGVSLKDNKVHFMSTGLEGNALIAVKNASGKIIWSWHVWATDLPSEHLYKNDKGEFAVLDRNLGATRADRGSGEQWRESLGLRYQWGRKDPFAQDNYKTLNAQLSPEETILYPTSFSSGNYQWMLELNQQLWSPSQKTIYDPCPVGYRVPVMDVWNGFTIDGENANRSSKFNTTGVFDYGWNFLYDDSGRTAWYPTSYLIGIWGDWNYSENEGKYWSASAPSWSSENAYRMQFYYNKYSDNPDFDCWLHIKDTEESMTYGMAVRCMKDEGHVDTSYPTVKITSISDILSTGAKVTANVSDEGISGVTERGVIYGTNVNITVDNARKLTYGNGGGEFVANITGLSHSTRYYVKAYARNERGYSYSKVMSFFTPYEGSAVNLSKDGTANCYIVPPIYSEYAFNASVKGNSEESVGSIASVEVLWETRNTSSSIEVGDVICDVSFDGNMVHFMLPAEPVPGNALIAVKDASGTILWSWHIWVVDFDPVETQQTYINGAIMMDRNLGALDGVLDDYIMGDYSAYGLYYQWGRKDPMTLSVNMAPANAIIVHDNLYDGIYAFDTICNSIDYTYSHPTDFYDDINWNYDNSLWGVSKTVNDPCPVGWRIPDIDVWNGWQDVSFPEDTYCLYVPDNYSSPAAYYPRGGYGDYSHTSADSFLTYGYYWSTTRDQQARMQNARYYRVSSIDASNKASVRCMKDDPTQDGSNEGYTGSDYEW